MNNDKRNEASDTTDIKDAIKKAEDTITKMKKENEKEMINFKNETDGIRAEQKEHDKNTLITMGIFLAIFALIGMNVSFLPKAPTDNVYHMIVFAVLLNVIIVTAIVTLFMLIDVITAPRRDVATKKKEMLSTVFYSLAILLILSFIAKQIFDPKKAGDSKETSQSSDDYQNDNYQNYKFDKPDVQIEKEDTPVIIPEQNSITKENTNNENEGLNEIDGEKNPDIENQDKEESFFPPAPSRK